MLVTWYPEIGTAEVLADDSLPTAVITKRTLESFPDHSQISQSVARPRAPNVEHFCRQNVSVTYHLRVRMGFDSFNECMAYRDDIMERMKGIGYIEINYDQGTSRIVYGAICNGISFSERYAVSHVIDFQFTGQRIAV